MAAARKRIAPSRPVPGGYRGVLDRLSYPPAWAAAGLPGLPGTQHPVQVVFPAPFGLAAGVNAGMLLLLTEVPAVIDGSGTPHARPHPARPARADQGP